MSPLDPEPAAAGLVELEVDGAVLAGFSEVSGLALELEVVETKQNTPDGRMVIRRLPGRPKAGEVTLTRGLTSDRSLYAWISAQATGQPQEDRVAALVMYDTSGQPVARYHLENAWPAKLEIGGLAAGATGGLTEKLVVSYESFRLE